jgi:hypothetical protein
MFTIVVSRLMMKAAKHRDKESTTGYAYLKI